MKTAVPTKRQLAYQDLEFGLFLHFGLRTFHHDNRDFDGKPMSLNAFNPTELDCNQWVTTARQAGMRYAVLTAKHHDGFCNWPTKTTDFSVAGTPWRGGKGDAIREFTDACRRQGVTPGIYYSPADAHCPFFKDEKAYDEYFLAHMRELLGNYGEVGVLWFDGCGSKEHAYDWPRIVGEIRRLQPDVAIFNCGDPDFRWVGNEGGVAPRPCWNTVTAPPHGSPGMKVVDEEHLDWQPAECDCKLCYGSWFYHPENELTIKGVEQLMGLYYYSVGRGCNLLLNIGPDRRGLLPEKEARRLLEFGAEIRRHFGSPFATLKDCTQADDGWEWHAEDWRKPRLIDHVVLQEDLTQGEHVRRFAVNVWSEHAGHPVAVYEGLNMGHKAICPFPQVSMTKLRVDMLEADGPVKLRALELHNAAGTR